MRLLCTVLAAIFVAAFCSAQETNRYFDEVQVIRDELVTPLALVISPDGNHVYVSGQVSDNIVTYVRNQMTGGLNASSEVRNLVNSDYGLADIWSMRISPDGTNLYAAGRADTLSVFRRDVETGALAFVEAFLPSTGIDPASGRVSAVVVSPDGAHVYRAGSDAVTVFSRDLSTGALTYRQIVRNRVNGVDGLSSVWSIAASPSGSHIYTAGAGAGALSVFRRDSKTGLLTFVEVVRDGVNGVDGLRLVRSVTVSSDGANVYAVGQSDEALAVFRRDLVTGTLAFVEVLRDGVNGVDGLDGAWSVFESPDGAYVYSVGVDDHALSVFRRDINTGALTFVEVMRNRENGISGLFHPHALTVSPDSTNVYATGRYFDGGALVAFGRDDSSEDLNYVESVRGGPSGIGGLGGPLSLTISPDGTDVYVTGDGEAVSLLRRSSGDGLLTFVEEVRNDVNGVKGLTHPHSPVVSPDGAHVYVAGRTDNALSVFRRDMTTGSLTFVEVVRDEMNGVDGLEGVVSVVVSPDGANLYAAGSFDNALAVFSRDSVTGHLEFIEVIRDGFNGVEGLQRAEAVAVAPNGVHLYVAGSRDNTLAVFRRDPTTGTLRFGEVLRNAVSDEDQTVRSISLRVSPNGEYVYVTGSDPETVTVYRRNNDTGFLTFVEVMYEGVNGVDGLWGPPSIIVSPDEAHIYVAGRPANTLTVFRKRVLPTLDGFVRSQAFASGISCATLELTSPGQSFQETTVTDLSGYYFFEHVPNGNYCLRVFSPGGGYFVRDDILIENESASTQNFLLPLADTAAIAIGYVTELETGDPIVGAKVEAKKGDRIVGMTYTYASGAYELYIPDLREPTHLQLHVTQHNYLPASKSLAIDPGLVAQKDLTLRKSAPGEGRIDGCVLLRSDGEVDLPIVGAQIVVSGGNSFVSGRTNVGGEFSFGHLTEGIYTLRASKNGYIGFTDRRRLRSSDVIQSTLFLEIPVVADLNFDGDVDALDLQLAISVVLNLETNTNADVNGDAAADAADVQAVINTIQGI